MAERKLVSVVMPCFNQGEFMEEALNSVLAQTYNTWECLIIDDGSTDNTEQIAHVFCRRDGRFAYYKKSNGGVASTRNYGITRAKGHYILPLDGDDKISPTYLAEAIEILDSNESVKVVYAKAEFFGAMTGPWNLIPFSIEQIGISNMIYCTALYRKADYEACGGYDEDPELDAWEDWDLWIAMLKNGGGVVQLSGVHFYYRKKPQSKLVDMAINQERQQKGRLKLFNKHNDYYIKYHGDPIAAYIEVYNNRKQLTELKQQLLSLQQSLIYRLFNFTKRVLR